MATMRWAVQRFELEEDFWINKNVVQFPAEKILAVLMDKYVMMSIVCNLQKQGWPQRQRRCITVGIHKARIRVQLQWDRFSNGSGRRLTSTWRMLVTASSDDLKTKL